MASQIAAVEDILIAKIKALFKNTVRTVDWAPPDWDEDFIKRILVQLPGVFVIFGGGPMIKQSELVTTMMTQWTIVAMTSHVQEAKARARGDAKQIGCYEMLEAIIPKLDSFEIDDIGTMLFKSWDNDAALKLQNQALMVQSAAFEMPMQLTDMLDPSALVPFMRFYDTFEVGQKPGAPDTKDQVELEQ